MRHILITLLILFTALASFGQNDTLPKTLPNPHSTNWAEYSYLKGDSGLINAVRDTNWIPRYKGTQVLWLHSGVDTAVWVYTGKWVKNSTGGSGIVPTLTFSKNATNDSLILVYNGTRYAVHDSLGVYTFSKTDGWGILSTLTNPNTAPNYFPRVDSATLAQYFLRRGDSSEYITNNYFDSSITNITDQIANQSLFDVTHNGNTTDLDIFIRSQGPKSIAVIDTSTTNYTSIGIGSNDGAELQMGNGSNVLKVKSDSVTGTKTLQFPNISGILANSATVNGIPYYPDRTGNINLGNLLTDSTAFSPDTSGLVNYYVGDSISNHPPASPPDSTTLLAGTTPTGVFAGYPNYIFRYLLGTWEPTAPNISDYFYDDSTGVTYKYNGTSWVAGPIPAMATKNFQKLPENLGPFFNQPLNFWTNNQKRGGYLKTGQFWNQSWKHTGPSTDSTWAIFANPDGTTFLHHLDTLKGVYPIIVAGDSISCDGCTGGGGSSLANFYLKDSTLSSDRTVDGGTHNLQFDNLNSLNVNTGGGGVSLSSQGINNNVNILEDTTDGVLLRVDYFEHNSEVLLDSTRGFVQYNYQVGDSSLDNGVGADKDGIFVHSYNGSYDYKYYFPRYSPTSNNQTILSHDNGDGTYSSIWGSAGSSETWEQTLTNQGSTPFTTDNTVDFGGHNFEWDNMNSFFATTNTDENGYLSDIGASHNGSFLESYINDSLYYGLYTNTGGALATIQASNINSNSEHAIDVGIDSIIIRGKVNDVGSTKLSIPFLDSSNADSNNVMWMDADNIVHRGHISTGGSVAWGSITGTLSDQTDLQSALNLKLNISDTASMLSPYLRKIGLSGGTTGQVLTKNSNTDYDYSWASAGSSATTFDSSIDATEGQTVFTFSTSNPSSGSNAIVFIDDIALPSSSYTLTGTSTTIVTVSAGLHSVDNLRLHKTQ